MRGCVRARFLNLYLQLLGGAKLDYDLLVLDSTPILPSPQSYTRFARAYMATMPAPVKFIPKVQNEGKKCFVQLLYLTHAYVLFSLHTSAAIASSFLRISYRTASCFQTVLFSTQSR